MTLAVATLVPNGIAIAADSRTSRVLPDGRHHIVTDNASKVFVLNDQSAGATAGIANISGMTIFRHVELFNKSADGSKRGRDLVDAICAYFQTALIDQKPNLPNNFDFSNHVLKMILGVYNNSEGELYEITIVGPDYIPDIAMQCSTGTNGSSGPVLIGMMGTAYRLLVGYDARLNVSVFPTNVMAAINQVRPQISYFSMELQDAVDFSVFLIKTTIMMQRFCEHESAGVGGEIDVAIVTDGHTKYLRCKELSV